MVDAWDALLRAQHGVFSLQQARANGISDSRLRWQVKADRWQAVHPRVYAAFTGPLDYGGRLWAAVLYAGPGSALGLGTAAHAWGLVAEPPATVDVMVQSTVHLTSARGVRTHRTARLPRQDVFCSNEPDRTGVERTVLDLVHASTRPEDVCALIAKSVQTGRTSAPRLAASLETRPGLHHTQLLRGCLALAGDGAHSVLEMRHAHLGHTHGLPAPTRQQRRAHRGRACYLDAVYEPYGVVVELDGRLGHTDPRRWWNDMDRDNQLQAAGLVVQRFPGFLVLTEPCRVAHDIAHALAARGWHDTPRRCTACGPAQGSGT